MALINNNSANLSVQNVADVRSAIQVAVVATNAADREIILRFPGANLDAHFAFPNKLPLSLEWQGKPIQVHIFEGGLVVVEDLDSVQPAVDFLASASPRVELLQVVFPSEYVHMAFSRAAAAADVRYSTYWVRSPALAGAGQVARRFATVFRKGKRQPIRVDDPLELSLAMEVCAGGTTLECRLPLLGSQVSTFQAQRNNALNASYCLHLIDPRRMIRIYAPIAPCATPSLWGQV